MPRYEAHMTADIKHAEAMKEIGEQHRWKYSQIHGCPIMGDKTYCYLTGYSEDESEIHKKMRHIALDMGFANVSLLRAKIEMIVYDTKTGVGVEK